MEKVASEKVASELSEQLDIFKELYATVGQAQALAEGGIVHARLSRMVGGKVIKTEIKITYA